MPIKKTNRKPTRKTSRRAGSSRPSFNRFLLAFILLVLLITLAAIAARIFIPRVKAPAPEKPESKAVAMAPHYEVFPKEVPPRVPAATPPPDVRPDVRPPDIRPGILPKVAIIIDDMGLDRKMTRKFLEMDAILTYSILPFSPLQEEVQETAQKKGLEIMLHLPMEPLEYPTVNPGPGALLTTMSPDVLIDQLRKDLAAVPGVVGVNNHMGSRMTEVSDQMNQIFTVLKKEGLFFIDSRTTPASLCRPAARLFRIPYGERDIFLDHVQKPEVIREQIGALIGVAIKKGEAIGIGHPHEITYEILQEMLPEITRKVKLVPASEVVRLQS